MTLHQMHRLTFHHTRMSFRQYRLRKTHPECLFEPENNVLYHESPRSGYPWYQGNVIFQFKPQKRSIYLYDMESEYFRIHFPYTIFNIRYREGCDGYYFESLKFGLSFYPIINKTDLIYRFPVIHFSNKWNPVISHFCLGNHFLFKHNSPWHPFVFDSQKKLFDSVIDFFWQSIFITSVSNWFKKMQKNNHSMWSMQKYCSPLHSIRWCVSTSQWDDVPFWAKDFRRDEIRNNTEHFEKQCYY